MRLLESIRKNIYTSWVCFIRPDCTHCTIGRDYASWLARATVGISQIFAISSFFLSHLTESSPWLQISQKHFFSLDLSGDRMYVPTYVCVCVCVCYQYYSIFSNSQLAVEQVEERICSMHRRGCVYEQHWKAAKILTCALHKQYWSCQQAGANLPSLAS